MKKLGERVLPEVIPHLEEGLNSPDENKRRGVCNGLIDIMNNCQSEHVRPQLVSLFPFEWILKEEPNL